MAQCFNWNFGTLIIDTYVLYPYRWFWNHWWKRCWRLEWRLSLPKSSILVWQSVVTITEFVRYLFIELCKSNHFFLKEIHTSWTVSSLKPLLGLGFGSSSSWKSQKKKCDPPGPICLMQIWSNISEFWSNIWMKDKIIVIVLWSKLEIAICFQFSCKMFSLDTTKYLILFWNIP